ncbi:Rho-binding antiterminator [Pseudoalteromonas luteoviolacea]|nr:Rho-binding antiterminator [Pseudoalteromonas luteoviolacea]
MLTTSHNGYNQIERDNILRKTPMRCEDTDLIEIACMKSFILKITTNTKTYEGKAKDIVYNEHRIQCLVIEQNRALTQIALDTVSEVTALTQNPFFQTIKLNAKT